MFGISPSYVAKTFRVMEDVSTGRILGLFAIRDSYKVPGELALLDHRAVTEVMWTKGTKKSGVPAKVTRALEIETLLHPLEG
ncbi:MAG: hypothetical protein IPO76_01160 [Elusimicrobia bacterium]|nr:hypothetical protein [Elusimicrobiota bacterium]